jgi:hypothetical protein
MTRGQTNTQTSVSDAILQFYFTYNIMIILILLFPLDQFLRSTPTRLLVLLVSPIRHLGKDCFLNE